MRRDWYYDPDKNIRYYLDPINGAMLTGWRYIRGKWYYFEPTGAMQHDGITPDGYRVGSDGAWIQ